MRIFSWAFISCLLTVGSTLYAQGTSAMNFSSTPQEAWKGNSGAEKPKTPLYLHYVGIGGGIASGSATTGREIPFIFSFYGFKTSALTHLELSILHTQINRDIVIGAGSNSFRPFSKSNLYSDVTLFWRPFSSLENISFGLGGLVNFYSSAQTVASSLVNNQGQITATEVDLAYQFLVSLGGCAKIDWEAYSTPTMDFVVRAQGNVSAFPFVGERGTAVSNVTVPQVFLGLGVCLRAKW